MTILLYAQVYNSSHLPLPLTLNDIRSQMLESRLLNGDSFMRCISISPLVLLHRWPNYKHANYVLFYTRVLLHYIVWKFSR